MSKSITLHEVFTDTQLRKLMQVFQDEVGQRNSPHDAICRVLEPLMSQINEKTGQENDLHFWGYLVEHALSQSLSDSGMR
jgi:hypothetical protein